MLKLLAIAGDLVLFLFVACPMLALMYLSHRRLKNGR
jgi:hypothetical protein